MQARDKPISSLHMIYITARDWLNDRRELD